jgi:SAM-dependent methyltransferase
MFLLKTAKNSLFLLLQGEWYEFYVRCLIALGVIDLKTTTIKELGLSSERSHSYSDSGRGDLQRALSTLDINNGDAIVDFGCGKGGALICFADFPFAKIVGVEISPRLINVAKKNLNKLRIKGIEIICGDAANFVDLDKFNYAYFFNPFPHPIMQSVIANIEDSIANAKRKFTIIYLNPECHDIILKNGVFKKVEEFDHSTLKLSIYRN